MTTPSLVLNKSDSFFPTDTRLPFFAYGVFKPGELSFLQIKDLVAHCEDCSICAGLRVRDGLPLAVPGSSGIVEGSCIHFRSGFEQDAYRRIGELEPEKQYIWRVADTKFGRANYLAGRNPQKGTIIPDYNVWNGRDDPLFTVAIDVVSETFNNNQVFDWNLKPLFRLEMAYLLLWTAIERYTSLRYHLGDRATQKVMQIADEQAFARAVKRHVAGQREICRSDDPRKKIVLDPDAPHKVIEYYYQIRHNLVHRGKGVPHDHERLAKSLRELLAIFKESFMAAFEESKWKGDVAS